MNPSAEPAPAPPPDGPAPTPDKTLRRLFLTLFLRGRSSRRMQTSTAPKSIGQKLALTLLLYAAFGFFALAFKHQPILALGVMLHSLTFVFLGMFVASSAGEVLFNKEEVDILLHRPIDSRTLLWAKIRVLLEVSLWIAGALNLAGLFVGLAAADGHWWFPGVHAISTILEAMFCTGCVVMVYQLCLRWFGRERLEGLMTTTQVVISIAAVLCGQIVPRVMLRFENVVNFSAKAWWIALLPPAWFAGIDDALAGSMAFGSWLLAALGVAATVTVVWIAFGKLARDYEIGLQRLSETVGTQRRTGSRRWIDSLVGLPPLRWWLRDPVVRASFLLSAGYLLRDRDVKLRIYPALGPFLILPIVMFAQGLGGSDSGGGTFGVAFAGSYLGMIPMLALNLLQYSQQWQAADIFRTVPLRRPAALCQGARGAVLFILTLPTAAVFILILWLIHRDVSSFPLLLPGVIALPIFALLPNLGGKGVPLSLSPEDAKAAGRALSMVVGIMFSMVVSGLAAAAWTFGWFWWMVLVESILSLAACAALRSSIARVPWSSLE